MLNTGRRTIFVINVSVPNERSILLRTVNRSLLVFTLILESNKCKRTHKIKACLLALIYNVYAVLYQSPITNKRHHSIVVP